MFITRAQPHAQSPFLFRVFGINLIHFFDEKKDGAAGNSIVFFFRCLDPLSRHLTVRILRRNCFEECNVFGNGKCELSCPRGEKPRCKGLARKSAKLFANTKGANFWQGKVKNSSPILHVAQQWWRHFRLSLSLSVPLSLSPSACLTHNIGSASALPIIKSVIVLMYSCYR